MNFNGMKITCKSCGKKLILVELGQSFGGNKESEDAYCCTTMFLFMFLPRAQLIFENNVIYVKTRHSEY